MTNNLYHTPVMLEESLEGLAIQPNGTYYDLTFGGGGHTRAILERLNEKGQVIALDQDAAAAQQAAKLTDSRFRFFLTNFRFIEDFVTAYELPLADGVLVDLGSSSHQLNQLDRGFAARLDGPLDMRMNQQQTLTAAYLLNNYTERRLTGIFKKYGEVRNAIPLARSICKRRKQQPFTTSKELKSLLTSLLPPRKQYQYIAKVFQALRIAVNDELLALASLLTQLPRLVKKGGRVVFLSYHSLEDRLVKRFLRAGNLEGEAVKDFYGHLLRPFTPLHSGVKKPRELEISSNNRARSAKMRWAVRNSS